MRGAAGHWPGCAGCGILGAVAQRNVLGGELEPCGAEPVTGFYRDGCCTSGAEDSRLSHNLWRGYRRVPRAPAPDRQRPGHPRTRVPLSRAGPGRPLVRDGRQLDARLPGRCCLLCRTGVDQRSGAGNRATHRTRGTRRGCTAEPSWARCSPGRAQLTISQQTRKAGNWAGRVVRARSAGQQEEEMKITVVGTGFIGGVLGGRWRSDVLPPDIPKTMMSLAPPVPGCPR